MAKPHIDVKSSDGSSPKPDSGSVQKPDGLEESSTSKTESLEDVKPDESLGDFISKNLKQDASTEEVTSDEEEAAKTGSDSDLVEKEKAEKEDGEKKEDSPSEEQAKKGEDEGVKGPVPYERFQEVVAKRQELEAVVAESKEKVTNYDSIVSFCAENGISAERYNNALKTLALVETNPAEALKQLTPLVEQLQMQVGARLPEDLQKKVDDGRMDLDDAKELAQARLQSRRSELTLKQQQERSQAAQRQNLEQSLAVAAQNWETSKRTSDPDYKPKAKDSDPDSKWEDVRDKYVALLNSTDVRGQYLNPVRTEKDMTGLMEKAYLAVDAKYKSLLARRGPTRKFLQSNGSSKTSKIEKIEDAETMQEAINFALEDGSSRR